MARHLFIAQQTLNAWMDQDRIEFKDNVMTIKADRRSFKMDEAVRFIKVEGEVEDKPGLLGRVKTNKQLEEMGAERYRDSVIFQEIAYKVQEGFLGEVFMPGEPVPEAVDSRARTQPVMPAQPAEGKKGKGDLTDEELLVQFLLNNTQK